MIKFYTTSFLALVGLKLCATYFTEFSLYGDEAQYWLWSQSLDLGYFSKPPLLAWFLSAHVKLFGDSFFSLKTFPLMVYFLICFSLFRMCLRLGLSKNNAIVCSLSFLIVPAASISSFLVSTDLLLIFFWIMGMTQLLDLRKFPSIKNFVLLAVYLGLSFLAKYAAIYFLLSFLILIIFDNKILKTLKNNLVGCLLFVLVCFHHQHSANPLNLVQSTSFPSSRSWILLVFLVLFLLSALFHVFPLFFLLP